MVLVVLTVRGRFGGWGIVIVLIFVALVSRGGRRMIILCRSHCDLSQIIIILGARHELVDIVRWIILVNSH